MSEQESALNMSLVHWRESSALFENAHGSPEKVHTSFGLGFRVLANSPRWTSIGIDWLKGTIVTDRLQALVHTTLTDGSRLSLAFTRAMTIRLA